ncbi:MAG: ATP-binding protein [Candidatus Woesearchaeota archaeon]
MRIREKTIIVFGISTLLLMVLLYFLLSNVLQDKFTSIENNMIKTEMDNVYHDIDTELRHMDSVILDYGSWDETHNYALGKNPLYSAQSVNDESLFRLDLNHFILLDVNGKVIFYKAVNSSGEIIKNPSSEMADYFFYNGYKFVFDSEEDYFSGIIHFPEGFFLIVSRPILRNDGTGPVAGTIIITRKIDDAFINSISSNKESKKLLLEMSQTIDGIDISKIPKHSENEILFMTGKDSYVYGYVITEDIFDNPVFVLKTYSKRALYYLEKETLSLSITAIFVAGIIFYIIIYLAMEYMILRRLILFDKKLTHISETKDISERFTPNTNDEICSLASGINQMLDSLESLTKEKDALFKANPDMFLHLDKELNILNYKNFGIYAIEESFDKNLALEKIFGTAKLASVRKCILKALSSKSPCVYEYSEGKIFYEIRIVPMNDKEVFLIIRDISDRKNNEISIITRNEELEKARRAALNIMEDLAETNIKLKELDQSKTDFLNVASHELKTPLTAISAYLDILEDLKGNFDPITQEGLDAIKRNSNQLKTLINNILEISRIESGRFELNYSDVDLKNKILMIVKNLEILCHIKGVALLTDIEENLPTMRTDDMRLEEIFNNLIGNAIKFTEKGNIIVHARREGDFIRVDIEDSGIGIPEDKIGRLFENFYQVDSSLGRRYGGTGLGLAITKRVIEFQGGSIDVDSIYGKGTTFTFRLPIFPFENGTVGGGKK